MRGPACSARPSTRPRSGEAVALNDQLIPLDRNGYLEECFFTLSYSPIRDETGIGGMLAVVAETTERVQNERQLALLRELATRTAHARTFEDGRDHHRNAQLYEHAKAMESRQAVLFESERVARAAAEQAARIKDEFLATISHEMRTPLNAIVGWVNVLQSSSARPADVQRAVEVIRDNAHAQAQLIEDLLDMSRIVTDKVRLDVQPVLLSSVIESAITSVQPAAAAKEIRLQRVLDPLAEPVKGDPGRLQHRAARRQQCRTTEVARRRRSHSRLSLGRKTVSERIARGSRCTSPSPWIRRSWSRSSRR